MPMPAAQPPAPAKPAAAAPAPQSAAPAAAPFDPALWMQMMGGAPPAAPTPAR
jgi:hypothetical protein